MKKFLVIQTAFIGDVILATGVLEKLHQFYPSAQIDFLVRKGNEGLLTEHPFINHLLIWDKKNGKYKDLLRILRMVRISKYDHVINLQRFAATGFLTVFSNAKETIGFDKNPWSRLFSKSVKHVIGTKDHPIHEVERNNALISHLTDALPARPCLHIPASVSRKVESYKSGKYFCIAPASVWFTKQYPVEKWIELACSLPKDRRIYLLGAGSDNELTQSIIEGAGIPNLVDLSGKLSLLESAALIKDAEMNFVNDSAPMHLASATNALVTAVYCSTVPWFGFGPLSDIHFVVESRDPPSCKPCGLHGYKVCPQTHFLCAKTIRNQQFIDCISRD